MVVLLHDRVDFGGASSFCRLLFLSSHNLWIQISFSSEPTTIWTLDDSAGDNIDYDTSIVMLLWSCRLIVIFYRLLVVVMLLWPSRSIFTGCDTYLIIHHDWLMMMMLMLLLPTTVVATAANSPITTILVATTISSVSILRYYESGGLRCGISNWFECWSY